MSTLPDNVQTLTDWNAHLGPDGEVLPIVELLAESNPILQDMTFVEANGITSHTSSIRTGLPTVYYRRLNEGVPTSKSTSVKITEGVAKLEGWCEVDQAMAELGGNLAQNRLNESMSFLEAMNQSQANTLFYGNSDTSPEEFNGFASRYSDLSAGNNQNIIDAGGTGSDNASMYIVVWGPRTVTGTFPKGSRAGFVHNDLGLVTTQVNTAVGGDAQGLGGAKLRVYQDQFIWDSGLVVADWRYVVRICNIDVSTLTGDYDGSDGFAFDLNQLLIRANNRIPNINMGKACIYMNRTLSMVLDIQSLEKSNHTTTIDTVDGKKITSHLQVPVRVVDSLLNTESRVV